MLKDICTPQAQKNVFSGASPGCPLTLSTPGIESEKSMKLKCCRAEGDLHDVCPQFALGDTPVLGSHLKHLFTLPHLEEVDNRLLAVGPYNSVFILSIVKKSLQDGLDGLGVQRRQRVLVCPPYHLLSHQPDVTGWVLQTLQRGTQAFSQVHPVCLSKKPTFPPGHSLSS